MRGFAWVLAAAVGLTVAPPAAGGPQVELLQCLDAIPTVVGTRGDDVLAGTTGDDVIAGLGGNDVIAGSWGNDVICGGDGNDQIAAGTGIFETDLVSGDVGDALVVTGSTSTTVVYAFAPAGVTVDLERGSAAGEGSDTLIGVHNVVGTEFGDVIQVSAGFNCLDGLGGDDVLLGLAGEDCLYGGTGNDTIDGGIGSDILLFQYAAVDGGVGRDRCLSAERCRRCP